MVYRLILLCKKIEMQVVWIDVKQICQKAPLRILRMNLEQKFVCIFIN
uniref:Uncharacterized protein n=1 Tax=CrAss-like virus sp. ctYsL76 TaxID=2826826 RepID=A0A8S5QL57_9CAUD|nr:MAG TPA: hypothetical protein [CrAss-like virus sp. ctYsL76]